MNEADIKILLVGDYELMREGLESLIRRKTNIEVVGKAEIGEEAVQMARQLIPDIILIDVDMSETDSIEATQQISNDFPDVKIIALSMYPKKSFVVEVLKAGAVGYILKDDTFDELVKAINIVIVDKTYLCPKVTSIIVDNYVLNHSRNLSVDTLLTNRELNILKLLAEGKPSKEIALIINMSVKTVDACRRRITQKLNVNSLAELVKYAIREGLTSLDS